MDSKELRIGNKILINGKIDTVTGIFHELGVKGDDIYFVQASNKLDYPIGQVEPIPLDEEILLKCGFKKHKAGAGGADMWQCINGWSYENSEWIFRGSAKCLHLVGYFNTQIIYLHELQNLFPFIIGKELKITF